MVNFGPLTAEIGWWVWGTPANFNRFRVLASLLHRCRSTEVNQTLHDVWPLVGLYTIYTFWGALAPNKILPGAKLTLCSSLAFSCIGSVTARHSSSTHQLNFAAWDKEWTYRTFTDGATYMAGRTSLWASAHNTSYRQHCTQRNAPLFGRPYRLFLIRCFRAYSATTACLLIILLIILQQ